MPEIDAEFAPKLQCLFVPKRMKVLYGGRGAGRSWGVGRALLIIGVQRPIRVLCAREFQNSISESVHKLLSDQIELLGLRNEYEIQRDQIIGKNGTTFSFCGIRNNTTKIKSYEGIDYCWVEEAEKVSQTSWEILVPTIRKEVKDPVTNEIVSQAEIWMTFNPGLATEYTYRRYVLKASEDSFVVKMTWRDNPWFPEVLYKEMLDIKKRDPDAYDNIWEGNPRRMLQGAVFAKELSRASIEERITRVHWARDIPVSTYWDLGKRDLTCIWFIQRVAMQWRVLDYYENAQQDIEHYLRVLQSKEYIYDTAYLPHDAKHSRIGMKNTIEKQVQKLGFRTKIVQKIAKKALGINAARMVFPSCYFDERNCEEGLERLRHYTYEVEANVAQDANGKLRLSEEPLHDENSNAADAFMTFAQSIKMPKKGKSMGSNLDKPRNQFVDTAPGQGWMA